jgi:hypothetical protein
VVQVLAVKVQAKADIVRALGPVPVDDALKLRVAAIVGHHSFIDAEGSVAVIAVQNSWVTPHSGPGKRVAVEG